MTSISPTAGKHNLADILLEVARMLPAQGPISVFIHHNTLHAFEALPFEEAVVSAGQQFGCQPFLSEEHYRVEMAQGRITEQDVEAVLSNDLGDRGTEPVAELMTRRALRTRIATHGIPEARGVALAWLLTETPVLERYREDLPTDARELAASTHGGRLDARDGAKLAVQALWRASGEAAARTNGHTQQPNIPTVRRHRDLLLATHGIDTDDWIHPILIRFVSAYLDQGLAHWPMPARGCGMYECFLGLYERPLARLCGPWARVLPGLLQGERKHGATGVLSLQRSLVAMGVAEEEWQEFLVATALALRGWAGMVCQMEERPDRVPALAVPATLVDFLAVRFLLERAALTSASGGLSGFEGPLARLRSHLRSEMRPVPPPSILERAWLIFHVAQLCGLSSSALDQLSADQVDALERELCDFDGIQRRRVLHLAYERHLRHRFYDALVQHSPDPEQRNAASQAVFCIDEREESFRRHLEEVDSSVETHGAPGFFGVPMYYRGTTDAHPRPLCPVSIHPHHFVAEVHENEHSVRARWQRIRQRAAGEVEKASHVGSRTLVRGALLTAILGPLSAVPLVLRVVFPGLAQRIDRRLRLNGEAQQRTRLVVERDGAPPPIGRFSGFTVDEMATIVLTLIENVGIADCLAPLVVLVGHASTSLNNPHESAHDCGACGGGHGGPNARAFAQMANDERVRGRIAVQGVHIPSRTWFVGAERNTCDNAITFFDADRIPKALRALFKRTRASFDSAREREAHERSRRFELVPSWSSPRAALTHVESRAVDLAQPRPEYGHATNAFCVLGRRHRTKGLFLDRRAFLASYDPKRDTEGKVLERVVAAVVPVVAGISLEYYFSYVDPTGYGSGTKLPHNVAGLLGVMDGAQSDLRTGLPWQMVEIHEPVRLTVVVECSRQWLRQVLAHNDSIQRLVENRWIVVACLEPDAPALWEVTSGGFKSYQPERSLAVVRGTSVAAYRGRRGHLPFVRLQATVAAAVGTA